MYGNYTQTFDFFGTPKMRLFSGILDKVPGCQHEKVSFQGFRKNQKSEYNFHTLKYDLIGSKASFCVISTKSDDSFMKNSHLKIQFYYEISIFSEKNENFCLQSKFTQANSTSKTFSILDLSILCLDFDFRAYISK